MELLLECHLKSFFFLTCVKYSCINILNVIGHGMNKNVSSLSLSLSRPAEGHLWSSVVRIVCFVMHNELVLHEIEAVGPGLERMADHVFHWGKTKTRREVTNLVFHWGKTRKEVTNLSLLMTLSPLHSLWHFPK